MNGTLAADLDHAAAGGVVVQLAADGWWERAQSLSLPVTPEDIDELLGASGAADVALEVLWPGPPIVAVGIRTSAALREPAHRIATRADWAPSEALEVLGGGAVGPAVRAEVGAINAWRSTGAVALDTNASPAAIQRALRSRLDLLDGDHPVALEVSYDQPCEVWWAIEVSSRAARGAAEGRTDQVADAVHRWLGKIDLGADSATSA